MDKLEERIAKYRFAFPHQPKKIALRLIYWNFMSLFRYRQTGSAFNDGAVHIGVKIAGGLGDCIFSAKYIRALYLYLGTQLEIDVICEEQNINILKYILANELFVKNIVSDSEKLYDLYLSVIRFPTINYYNPKRLPGKLIKYIHAIESFQSKNHLLKQNDFLARCYSLICGQTRENQADINNILNMKDMDFCLEANSDIKALEKKFNCSLKKLVTLQSGGGYHFKDMRDTRQWPLDYYNILISLLKNKYPDITIAQLGERWQEPMRGIDLDLRGQTTVAELFALLKLAKVHISQEGGLVIARHYLSQAPSVVLFGPTDETFFGFEENINLSARTCAGTCEWLNPDWMKSCLKSGGAAECMTFLTPRLVLREIEGRALFDS